jgi:hypothetical protein
VACVLFVGLGRLVSGVCQNFFVCTQRKQRALPFRVAKGAHGSTPAHAPDLRGPRLLRSLLQVA